MNPLHFYYFFYESFNLLVEGLGGFHHHHMAGLGKNLHLRALHPALKKLRILYRSELVVLSTQDERREDDASDLIHQVEPIAGQEIAVEDIGPGPEHLSDTPLDQHRWGFARIGKLIYPPNGPLKIVLDPA